MFRTWLSLTIGFFPLGASADCLPPLKGLLEVHGEIESCSQVQAPHPSGAPFLRIQLNGQRAEIIECESEKCIDGLVLPWYVTEIEKKKYLFVPANDGKTCHQLRRKTTFVAKVMDQCCDTHPPSGICALGGPVVEPFANVF